MRPNNPACYECPKGRSGVHIWKLVDAGAICTLCKTKLDAEQARDCFFDHDADSSITTAEKP